VDVYEIETVPGLLDHPHYWDERPATDRPNVMGLRRGTGGGRSLLFSSHIDTVPAGPDRWSRDPWSAEIADGKLYGLGAYDMKAGLAASIMVVKALQDLGLHLRGDLMVESVVDEEFGGCNGTLAARLKYNADLAVVPEPTNLVVCPAHHGGLMLRVTFHGKPGWGFSPESPVDPTSAIARFIVILNAWAAKRATQPAPQIYADNPALPVLINQLKAGDVSLPFFADRVPSEAWLSVWIEAYPGTTQDQIVEDLQAYYRQAQTTDPVLSKFEPEWRPIRWLDGSAIPADHPGITTFAEVLASVQGTPATIQGAPFACDGHIFNLYSPTPMLLLGPTGGQPHSPDEFVNVDDYCRLVETFILGAIRWCGLSS
jgi:acetylornithine deacetylase